MKNWRVIIPFKTEFETYVIADSEQEAKAMAKRVAASIGFRDHISDSRIKVYKS